MVKYVDPPPNRIREVRKHRRLTLRQVAEPLHTTQTQISRFETGERQPDLIWLRRIAQILDTNPGQLLSFADNPVALSDAEFRVIDAMRRGKPHVAQTIDIVAQALFDELQQNGSRQPSVQLVALADPDKPDL